MALTISQAQAVANLLQHLDGARTTPTERLAKSIDLLARSAEQTLQVTLPIDAPSLAVALEPAGTRRAQTGTYRPA